MDNKTIFLELPSEMVDKIDRENVMGDRSSFITDLLSKQLGESITTMNASTELMSRMDEASGPMGIPGEIGLINSRGISLGKFNINTVEGFEHLADKICEMSDDPLVRMRARRWR